MKTVAIVGASLSGWRAAQELREQGFDGNLIIIGAERRRPYDRPPLSKEFLTSTLDPEELSLANSEEDTDLGAQWRLGQTAVAVDTRRKSILLGSGEEVRADGIVLATGATRSVVAGAPLPSGGHLLHTLDDAVALRSELRAGSRVVIIGGGLLGAEVASACRSIGAHVTVVDSQHVPLVHTLGIEIAALCISLHEDHGVRTRYGTPAARILSNERVTGVELADGRVIPADIVVTGVGARPATAWLRGSGIRSREGVLTDAGCVTRLPNVVAVGDVAQYHCVHRGRKVRFDHWSNAMNQPPVAARNLLAGRTVAHYTSLPHFWSRQYGCTLQFAGYAGPRDKIEIVDGSVDSRKFVALYWRSGKLVAVFAMNSPRQFAVHRRKLLAASWRRPTTGPQALA